MLNFSILNIKILNSSEYSNCSIVFDVTNLSSLRVLYFLNSQLSNFQSTSYIFHLLQPFNSTVRRFCPIYTFAIFLSFTLRATVSWRRGGNGATSTFYETEVRYPINERFIDASPSTGISRISLTSKRRRIQDGSSPAKVFQLNFQRCTDCAALLFAKNKANSDSFVLQMKLERHGWSMTVRLFWISFFLFHWNISVYMNNSDNIGRQVSFSRVFINFAWSTVFNDALWTLFI